MVENILFYFKKRKMVNAITKGEDPVQKEVSEISGIAAGKRTSIQDRLKLFNAVPTKKLSIVVGSVNQKNIHSSSIISVALNNNQLITSDLSGFVKVWKF